MKLKDYLIMGLLCLLLSSGTLVAANLAFPSDLSTATPATGDLLLLADVDDSNASKKATIANVVGANAVGGLSDVPFSWTTSEQEYPYHTLTGDTVYAKIVECGACPNNTTTTDAHGITNLDRILPGTFVVWDDGTGQYNGYNTPTTYAFHYVNQTNVALTTNQDFSAYTCYAYLVYNRTGD